MGRKFVWLTLAALAAAAVVILLSNHRFREVNIMDNQTINTVPDNGLSLSSPEFKDGANIPASYSCKGQNTNPPLAITGVPKEAKSLALILHDPDAVNSDFVHWLMWDIPADTNSIAAHSVPVGAVQGKNGSDQSQYIGPCPPAGTGTHRYMFELYALDKPLTLDQSTDRLTLEKAMEGHVLAHTKLTGLFAAE